MTELLRRTPYGVLVLSQFPLALDATTLLARVHHEEATLARGWGERRQRTFAMGRLVARAALTELGAAVPGPILRDDRGAPRLPPPLALSLSHKDEVAAALVCAAGEERIGVDIEPLSAREHARDIAAHVLTERERAELVTLDEDARRRAVLVRFALKEALYKALDPFVRRYVGFLEVEARPAAEQQGQELDAELTLLLPAQEGALRASGRVLLIDDLVVALARVARV